MAQPASQSLFTPKQVALALGVSESSVKRWCDTGRLRAGRTVGGHRKLPLSSVVEMVRQTGQQIADPSALGMVAVSARRKPARVHQELLDCLLSGDEPAARELLLGLYQQGSSIVEIGDELISPVFGMIGDGWERGEIAVHEERRSCEIAMTVLHELRRWIPAAPDDAPVAMTATPMSDFAEVPIRLVELMLQTLGWRTIMAGSGLPLSEILAAAQARRPALLCLSVTHLHDAEAYVGLHNEAFGGEGFDTPLVVGGRALSCDQAGQLRCDFFSSGLGDFESWLGDFTTQGDPE